MSGPAIGESVDTIRGARIGGAGRELLPDEGIAYDVFLRGGRVADIAPAGAVPPRGAVLDADGAWLIPGLWDHHVHMLAWALTAQRTHLDGLPSAAATARAMAEAPVLADGRRVGVGYRDALWADAPSLDVLDAATGGIPTYLVNADLHSVWLNSAALRREGLGASDGVLREQAAFEIGRRLNDLDPAAADAVVARAAADAAARGVVGIVDLDMTWNAATWTRRLAAGFDTLRVEFGIYPEHLERAIAEGLRTGDPVGEEASALVRVGSLKVITDGSLGTRTAACSHGYPDAPHDHGLLTVDPAMLQALMTDATAAGLSCAIHAIGDAAISHALDAFAATSAWGTIEHAQLVAHADLPRFARLGVGASVQPEHAIDDRDLSDTVWAGQTALPYPLRALADSGANLLFGSDAPVAALDPWATMAAAVHRSKDDRAPWHPEQQIDPAIALAASSRGGSTEGARIEPGAPADLALCAVDPLAAPPERLRTMAVSATLLGGRLTHRA
ncbi:amidohydrolase [Microbacterium sp. CJ88]|uniref:amidohydrolase n=1 Tax=Microbacterium sp. CJ88 TaxID=3445672 RepID=UPI003F6564FF